MRDCAKTNKKILYGIGNLGYGVISQTVSSFFMFFGTSVLKISGTLIGIAIALSTLWDGIADTVIGYYSDNYPILKMGKRNGYMLIAVFGMTITNLLLWCVPMELSAIQKFFWVLISLLILETFNTMFSTPYMALGGDMICNYHQRTSIQSYKTLFYLLGVAIPSILIYIFLPDTIQYPIGQLNPMGYRYIAITTSCICLVVGLICTITTIPNKKNKSSYDTMQIKNNNHNKPGIKDMFSGFFSSFKNKNQVLLILGCAISVIATTILTGVGLHFFTYCFFFSSKEITILLVSLMLGMIISQPLWYNYSTRIDKKPTLLKGIYILIVGVMIVIVSYLFRVQFYNLNFIILLVAVFICGVGSGALFTIPQSMYSDIIVKLNKEYGINKSATYSGALTFISNIINALVLLIIGVLLDLIGFNASEQVQSLKVQAGLAVILFAGIQVSLIICIIIFSKYNINKNDVK